MADFRWQISGFSITFLHYFIFEAIPAISYYLFLAKEARKRIAVAIGAGTSSR
ncbi:hypothetical protein [Flavobacterium sp. 3HN19-14]|uniref:hypothetical protein n=1 Tax=Flavobacterium sp. 3HN19-14 TaxID=3448133 RepID=UPI003EE3B1F3